MLPLLKRYDITVDDTEFADTVILYLSVETAGFTAFSDAVREMSGGKLAPDNVEKKFGAQS